MRLEGQEHAGDPVDVAVAALKRGGLVILPTETVYGLAADAANPTAVAAIFEAKEDIVRSNERLADGVKDLAVEIRLTREVRKAR